VPDLTEVERIGLGYFTVHCQACHGENGRGTRVGPPLAHKIYEPSHHADGAFVRAVRQGVVAHHWRFGNMPALPAVTDHEVNAIIRYVRALQRANGIH
jgi:mono/diheme cytochrome c family protein